MNLGEVVFKRRDGYARNNWVILLRHKRLVGAVRRSYPLLNGDRLRRAVLEKLAGTMWLKGGNPVMAKNLMVTGLDNMKHQKKELV